MELSVLLPRTPQSLASPVDQVSTLRASLLSRMNDKQLITMYALTDERTSLMQCSSQCAGERGWYALMGLTPRYRGGCTIRHGCPLACRPTMFPGEFSTTEIRKQGPSSIPNGSDGTSSSRIYETATSLLYRRRWEGLSFIKLGRCSCN